MLDYQVTRHDCRGTIIGTVNVLAPDDDFARLSAKSMLSSAATVEVWQANRFVGTLPDRGEAPQSGAPRHQRYTDPTPLVRATVTE